MSNKYFNVYITIVTEENSSNQRPIGYDAQLFLAGYVRILGDDRFASRYNLVKKSRRRGYPRKRSNFQVLIKGSQNVLWVHA